MSKESEHSGGKLEKPVTADEQPELTDTELEGTSGGVNRSFSGGQFALVLDGTPTEVSKIDGFSIKQEVKDSDPETRE